MSHRWSTPEQLAAALAAYAERIPGWRMPAVHAVGISSASSSAETEFPHVSNPGHELPALVLALVTRHVGGTATYPLGVGALSQAIELLEPAEAYPGSGHATLHAWREVLAEMQANPARTACAVFIADLHDPVSSEQDGSLRSQLLHQAP